VAAGGGTRAEAVGGPQAEAEVASAAAVAAAAGASSAEVELAGPERLPGWEPELELGLELEQELELELVQEPTVAPSEFEFEIWELGAAASAWAATCLQQSLLPMALASVSSSFASPAAPRRRSQELLCRPPL